MTDPSPEGPTFVDRALDALPDLFFVFDAEGTFLRWNARVPEVTGYEEAEIEDLHPTQLFAGEDADHAIRAIQTLIERGRPVTFEADLVTAEDEHIPYEFRGELLTDRSSPEPIIAGIGRDVTERRERARQLQVVDRVLRHNLRNDVNAIKGSAERLRQTTDDAEPGLERIIDVSERLLGVASTQREINDILSNPPARDVLDMVEVVERSVAEVAAAHPDVEIDTALPAAAEAIAAVNVGEAVTELVENAVVHHDGEPTVEVAVELEETVVRVHVADDGPGIPEAERGVLTGERDIEPLYHGSGLGLWKVHLIVDRSGGILSFASNDPRGSVVTIELDRDVALA